MVKAAPAAPPTPAGTAKDPNIPAPKAVPAEIPPSSRGAGAE